MLEYESVIENNFYDTYKINKGDSLYKISKKFNVNTNLLAELNGLDIDDYIYPEQVILIPKSNVSYYITKEGDTLKNISEIFKVSEEKLKAKVAVTKLNGIEPEAAEKKIKKYLPVFIELTVTEI